MLVIICWSPAACSVRTSCTPNRWHRAAVGDGFLSRDHGLLLVRGQGGGPGCLYHLAAAGRYPLEVVGLYAVPAVWSEHDEALCIGEVALVLRNTRRLGVQPCRNWYGVS